ETPAPNRESARAGAPPAPAHASQRKTALRRRTRALVREEETRDAAAVGRPFRRRGCHIVDGDDRVRLDLTSCELAGEIEVHDVAAVISVEVENASAAVGRWRRGKNLLTGWGEEHVAPGARRAETDPDVAKEEGKVARAAARHDA